MSEDADRFISEYLKWDNRFYFKGSNNKYLDASVLDTLKFIKPITQQNQFSEKDINWEELPADLTSIEEDGQSIPELEITQYTSVKYKNRNNTLVTPSIRSLKICSRMLVR